MISLKKGVPCRYHLQPEVVLLKAVEGERAEQLAAELPGLVTVQATGAARQAVVGEARKHEKLLEKAGQAAWPLIRYSNICSSSYLFVHGTKAPEHEHCKLSYML